MSIFSNIKWHGISKLMKRGFMPHFHPVYSDNISHFPACDHSETLGMRETSKAIEAVSE